MVDLALHYGKETTPLNEIADRQDISQAYLEQLMASLRKSGLVQSIRGAQGGYRLTKSPDKITIGEVLRSLEGPLVPVDCVDKMGAGCEKMEGCYTIIVWEKLRDAIDEVLDSLTLKDLMEQNVSKQGD